MGFFTVMTISWRAKARSSSSITSSASPSALSTILPGPPAARAFVEAGIHVICDKPMTTTVAEAQKLVDLVEKSGHVFLASRGKTKVSGHYQCMVHRLRV
jgi:hypothetical protein